MIMKEELTNRKGSTLAMFLTGGILGAGAALVLAPQSGRETRKDLKRIADRFSQAVDIGRDLYGESRVFVSKAVEAGTKAYVEEKPLEPISNERRSVMVSILASGIIGAGIGAGIALLLAPKSGSETREDLKRLASTTRERVVSAIDKGKDLYVAGKGAITGTVEADKIPYVEGKQEVMHAV
jgi:gas vesicle protein